MPTTFFHAVRQMRQYQRGEAKRPCDVGRSMAAALAHEVDAMIAHREQQPAPDEANLLAAARRCRQAQRAYAATPEHNGLITATAAADELDAAIRAVERQAYREQASDQAHRKVVEPKPQLMLFADEVRA